MVTRIGGARRKTRGIYRKSRSLKGKISIRRYLQELTEGTKVALVLEPGVHEGVFFRRFHGKIGVVDRKKGACYVVKIKDGNKAKEVISHPAHLKVVA